MSTQSVYRMRNSMKKVAVASTNGELINEHFGRAEFFYIYNLYENGYEKEEIRDVIAACQHTRAHSETNFDKVISLLSDCDALLVQKIGESAAAYLVSKNVRVFEAEGNIDAVLNKFISDKLLE